MKSSSEFAHQLDQVERLATFGKNPLLFLQGKLLFDFVWFVLILYSAPQNSSSGVNWVIIFPILDMILLAVYYGSLERSRVLASIVIQLSVMATALGIAATIHLLADFTWPGFLLYFALILSATPIKPWLVAGMSSIAYGAIVGIELTGIAATASGKSATDLQNSYLLPVFVVIGLWLIAFVMNQVVATSVRPQPEQTGALEDAERRIEAESIWSTVGKTLTATQDLDEVLTNVIRVLNEKMQVEAGSVLLRDIATDELYFAKTLHGNVEQFAAIRIKIGQGVAGWVAQTGQPTLVHDTTQDPRWFDGVDVETGFKTRSILCVPLLVKGDLVGIIELLNKKRGTFNDKDLQLLQSIASPVAIAIQNARLHLKVQQQLAELTTLFHKVEQAKKEWEETVDAIDEGITLIDENSKILRANSTLAQWLNSTPSALVGQHCYEAIHGTATPPAYCSHCQVLNNRSNVCHTEFDEPRLNGTFLCTTYPFHDSTGQFVGTVNVLKNITTQKRLEAQLIQSEKLAAVGELATSLAHEINNPLQGILGCLDLIRADVKQNPRALEFLEMTQDEIDRLATIVQRLLNFYRPAGETSALFDVRAAVENILALAAKRLQHANVSVQVEWQTESSMIQGVENQLKQVFLNLVLNAIESMPDGGKLRVESHMRQERGKWIVIDFIDSGEGIAPDTLERIFDPFFTTKTQGTGLGLSICQTLVSSHGGRLTVQSAVGQGSTFSVWLPAE
ncbi:MAG: GAF domain-containing protein [Chloroflexi bacterium]|nr:GAF domain-containing protein [Chloroflexota bacterium]